MNVTSELKFLKLGIGDHHGITSCTIYSESNSRDDYTVDHFKDQELSKLIQGFYAKDIYNTDKTRLFFNLLPYKTLVEKVTHATETSRVNNLDCIVGDQCWRC